MPKCTSFHMPPQNGLDVRHGRGRVAIRHQGSKPSHSSGSSLSDFQNYDASPKAPVNLAYPLGFPIAGIKQFKPKTSRRKRHHISFLVKIVTDFAYRWREVLCKQYNSSNYIPFRRFAYAFVSIITGDFSVHQMSQESGYEATGIGRLVPKWTDLRSDNACLFRTEGDPVVVLTSLPDLSDYTEPDKALHAMVDSLIRPHKLRDVSSYLLFTIRGAIRVHIDEAGHTSFSKYYKLFHGIETPTSEAIEFLLDAVQPNAVSDNRIRHLPLELQDMILDEVSQIDFERERIGYILDVGSEQRYFSRLEGRKTLPKASRGLEGPTVCFGWASSGLMYEC